MGLEGGLGLVGDGDGWGGYIFQGVGRGGKWLIGGNGA